jgi:hypothetical protein
MGIMSAIGIKSIVHVVVVVIIANSLKSLRTRSERFM